MQIIDTITHQGYHLKVDSAGRIVVPAEVRAHYNIRSGDRLILRSGKSGLELKTYEQIMRDAQSLVGSLVPGGRSLSDELIAERRRDATDE